VPPPGFLDSVIRRFHSAGYLEGMIDSTFFICVCSQALHPGHLPCRTSGAMNLILFPMSSQQPMPLTHSNCLVIKASSSRLASANRFWVPQLKASTALPTESTAPFTMLSKNPPEFLVLRPGLLLWYCPPGCLLCWICGRCGYLLFGTCCLRCGL